MKGLFVTGTGTDVGKTYVSALLVRYLKDAGFRSSYYKAAASGNARIDGVLTAMDAKFVTDFAGLPEGPNELVSYVFEEPVSPHLAAGKEGVTVELSKIRSDFAGIASKNDFVTVEGAGGILCPLSCGDKTLWLTDVIRELDLPVLIVANAKLGSINATGLTVSYLKSAGLSVCGIVLNEYDDGNDMERDNRFMIESHFGVPVVAVVAKNGSLVMQENRKLESLYG